MNPHTRQDYTIAVIEHCIESLATCVDARPVLAELKKVEHVSPMLRVINPTAFDTNFDRAAENAIQILKKVLDAIKSSGAIKSAGSLVTGGIRSVSKSITTTLTGLSIITAVNNIDTIKQQLTDLSNVRNPTLVGSDQPLPNGDTFPLIQKVITFDDITTLLKTHIQMMEALITFLRGTTYVITTLPDIDVPVWLRPIKTASRVQDKEVISTPILFDYQVASTVVDDKEVWKTTAYRVKDEGHPTEYTMPKPLNLTPLLSQYEALLKKGWAMEGEAAKLVADLARSLDDVTDKKSKTKVDFMRHSIHAHYTVITGSTLSLAVAATQLIEHSIKLYRKENTDD